MSSLPKNLKNERFISQKEIDRINAKTDKTQYEKIEMIKQIISKRENAANRLEREAKEQKERMENMLPKVAKVASDGKEKKKKFEEEAKERQLKEQEAIIKAGERLKKEKIKENLKSICLPLKYEDAKFQAMDDLSKLQNRAFENGVLIRGLKETFKRQEEFKNDILKFNHGRIIPFSAFVFGGTGVGKTALIAGYAKEVVKAGYTARFITAEDFYGIWGDRISQSGYAVKDAMIELNELKSCDLLIVDDVLKFKLTDFEFRKLTNLLDNRHNHMKETILTSNKTKEVFLSAIGDLQESRIKNGSFMSFSFGKECFDIRLFEKRIVRW